MSSENKTSSIFRFRSLKHLLKEYKDENGDIKEGHAELEKQTIFFASRDKLNDPLEGYRYFHWDGDKIVWENFLKHYICALIISYANWRICGEVYPILVF